MTLTLFILNTIDEAVVAIAMDIWKYYSITHRHHLVCNPLLPEKLERLCTRLSLRPRSRVLDIACGKGEFLIRLAELYGVSGVGVDLSPYCIDECIAKQRARAAASELRFIMMNGADYKPAGQFDVTACLGASFVFGDYARTLRALRDMTVPGGLIVTGEPFWKGEPDLEYLKLTSTNKAQYATGFGGNISIGEGEGLGCVYAMESSPDDWDNYETLQWGAVDLYSRENPQDPELGELLEKKSKEKEYYLSYERRILGWGVYVFRKSGTVMI